MACRRPRIAAALLLIVLAPALAPALDAEEELLFFRKLYADGLYEVAAGQMEDFLARHPEHGERAEVYRMLGRSYLALEDAEPAMIWLERFVMAKPNDPRACQALFDAAQAGVKAGRLEGAEPLLDWLLRDYSTCEYAEPGILLAARVKAARDERAAALQLLSYLIDSSGSEELVGRALYERAGLKEDSETGSGRRDLEALKASLPASPLAGFAALALARQAAQQGRLDAALSELDWLLRRFEEEELATDALVLRARIHETEERFEEAARDLKRLRERYPERVEEGALLAREVDLLVKADKGREALKRARRAQEGTSESSAAWALTARALEAAGKGEEAVQAWERAAALDPAGEEGLDALRQLFGLLVERKDGPRLSTVGRLLLGRLADMDAKAQVLIDLGDHHAREGEQRAARRDWESVESECPGSALLPEALYRLALLSEERGDWEESESLYRRLLREHGASARGIQARENLDAVERYYRVDEAAAVEALLGLLDEERRQGAVRGREFRVGNVILEELKDFPRAAEYFTELAGEQEASEGRAWALLLAGRAALREAERLRLAGKTARADRWVTQAEGSLTSCRQIAAGRAAEEAELELTLLGLSALSEDLERLPLLDRHLSAYPDSPRSAHLYYERGQIYRRGSWSDPAAARKRAMADFERVLSHGEQSSWGLKARLAAGQTALAGGDLDRAEELFAELVKRAPRRFEGGEARFGLGEVDEKRKRFRKALENFQDYLAIAPTSPRRPRCLIHIGDCHYFLQEWDAARAAYARMAGEHPENLLVDDAIFRWALCEEQRGEAAAGRERLEWLLSRGSEPFRREAAWRLGKASAEAGDGAEAARALEQLMALGWEGRYVSEGGLLLGRLLLEGEDGERALAHYDSLLARVDLGDEKPLAQSGRIRALLLTGMADEAWTAWETLRETPLLGAEERGQILLAFARARLAVGDLASARRFLDDCLRDYSRSEAAAWALHQRALLAGRAGAYEEALADFDRLLRDYADRPAALDGAVKAAGILYSRGQFEEASVRYEAAMGMSPRPSADLLYYSALALEKTGHPETALERVQALLARYPEDERVPEAMMKVGYFLQSLGQYDRAVLAYRNAELFQDREGKARLHFWLADCLEAKGDREGALAAFLKVGYLYGDQGLWSVTATLRAATLYENGGELRQARQLYEKVLSSQGPGSDFGRAASEGLRRLEGRDGQG